MPPYWSLPQGREGASEERELLQPFPELLGFILFIWESRTRFQDPWPTVPDCQPTVADLVNPIPASSETKSVQLKVITPPKQVQSPVLRVGWEDIETLPTPLTCGWLQEDHVL